MIRALRPSYFIAAVLMAAGGLASAQSTPTAPPPGSSALAQKERAVCDGVQQDRAACLREAGAAQEEARRSGLTSAAPSTYDRNALARCDNQPVADRADCEARITGAGAGSTSKDGSVMGGGVIRETVTPIPAPRP